MVLNSAPSYWRNLPFLPPNRVWREALVEKAVERLVNYDAWLIAEVEKGLAAADRGELVGHEEVGKLIDQRYPGPEHSSSP